MGRNNCAFPSRMAVGSCLSFMLMCPTTRAILTFHCIPLKADLQCSFFEPSDAEEDAKEVSDAEASGSSKGGSSPSVEAEHDENKDQGESNTVEGKQGPILEPPTKKQKRGDSVEVVEEKNAGNVEYSDKNEGGNGSKGEDTTAFKAEGGSDDDNNLNEDSSDSISSLSSSDSEKAEQMDRNSRRQSGEFSKSLQQPLQTTIIDMLRKSSNELLSSLQRYYDSK